MEKRWVLIIDDYVGLNKKAADILAGEISGHLQYVLPVITAEKADQDEIKESNLIVVGKIKIGNDVLIAPGAYVNFDVPDHSIVIGNPGKIIPKQNATEGYIASPVE